jgi:hypothetical protein
LNVVIDGLLVQKGTGMVWRQAAGFRADSGVRAGFLDVHQDRVAGKP